MPLPIKDEDLKNITKKVYALYAKHGFDGISMDEVSRQTNISKATLYRYFNSKEDIVRSMADLMISNLDSVRFSAVSGIDDVVDATHVFYEKSIMVTAITSSQFLNNLENKFPDIYAACRASLSDMDKRFAAFFKQAVDKGFFRGLPFPLMSRQFAVMLPTVIDMDYLERNGMTLQQALREYYRMFLCQILNDRYLFIADDEGTFNFAHHLADVLINEFFIDSVRR